MKNQLLKLLYVVSFATLIFYTSNYSYAAPNPSPATGTANPGTETGGIVPCGRSGQPMCTLCDLIKGLNIVIQYVMKIAIGVALLIIAIGGIMYIVSAGGTSMMEMAKATIKNAAIGFIIVFAAFLIVDTTLQYLGTVKTKGQPTLGITITSWGQFDCTAKNR